MTERQEKVSPASAFWPEVNSSKTMNSGEAEKKGVVSRQLYADQYM
jgi:hypothetical protein